MDQLRNEDHRFSGQNTQQLDIEVLLHDDEAFGNVFFPPTSMDYNPMNINEIIDFNELPELLSEENVNVGVHFVLGNEGDLKEIGSLGSNMEATQIKNGELMNVKLTDEQNVKKLNTTNGIYENVFFPPISMDYNPMDINEIIDFNELHEILNEGMDNFVVGNEGGLNGSHGSNMVTTDQINNGELMNVKLTDEQNVKKWKRRKRVEKGSKEAALMKELHKIRNREAAARAFAEKKAYIQGLELEVQKFRKKNANLKKLLLFVESSIGSDMTRKQLKRTASGPM